MKKENQQPKGLPKDYFTIGSYSLENEVWITTEQAMQHLKVSRSTMYRLRKQYNIPNLKIGGSPMFPKHLLNKVLITRSIKNVIIE